MKRILVLTLGLLLFSTCLKSQEKIKLFYDSNWKITNEGKAIYYREAEYDLSNFELDGKVFDYTLSGNPVMEGEYLHGKRNGNFIFYHHNGEISSKGEYKYNRRVGKWKYFYASGQLKQIVLFNDVNDVNDFSVVEFYTRNGNQMIINGTGNWVNDSIKASMFNPDGFSILKGQFKDSLKHGEWKLIEISNNKLIQSERFKKGKFISATMFSPHVGEYGTVSSEVLNKIPDENYAKLKSSENFELDTTVYPASLVYADVETIFKTVTGKEYKIQNRESGYLYGDRSLFEFIATNINYPVSALERNITGKVYVGVVIDPAGNTKSVQLVKGVHKVLDEEAIRVVKLITNWMPALRDGKEVESTITIPVNFNIKK